MGSPHIVAAGYDQNAVWVAEREEVFHGYDVVYRTSKRNRSEALSSGRDNLNTSPGNLAFAARQTIGVWHRHRYRMLSPIGKRNSANTAYFVDYQYVWFFIYIV